MDKQDFQEQDFMEILMRLPCLMASIYVYGGDHTRVWTPQSARLLAGKK